tara:strand:- start:162 stop:644 length:483 start_codon:yes stop_codon:yes gene_type:complete
MQLDKILAISGRQGLYEMKAETRSGIVAISLIDGKRITSSINNQISFLSEIQVYCIGKEIPLAEVLKKLLKKESGNIASIKPKASAADLKAYFSDLVEQYDEDRVYSSDIKKIIQWYNILVTNKMITLEKSAPKPLTKLKKDLKKNNNKATSKSIKNLKT